MPFEGSYAWPIKNLSRIALVHKAGPLRDRHL